MGEDGSSEVSKDKGETTDSGAGSRSSELGVDDVANSLSNRC